ncbi:MAG: helix-turn-helix transcriptional regulator [Candidatus Woesearchaeota archaeon]
MNRTQSIIGIWHVLIILGLLIPFMIAVMVTSFYVYSVYSPLCGCHIPLWLIIIVLSISGILIGTLTYYILTKNRLKEKSMDAQAIFSLLSLLDKTQLLILKELVLAKGQLTQSTLRKKTQVDKVKLSRALKQLEQKEIIQKTQKGMTNTIKLDLQILTVLEGCFNK